MTVGGYGGYCVTGEDNATKMIVYGNCFHFFVPVTNLFISGSGDHELYVPGSTREVYRMRTIAVIALAWGVCVGEGKRDK